MIKKTLGRLMFASTGWSYKVNGEIPPAAVYITGQHTSLLEGYLSIAFSLCNSELKPIILIAKEYFKPPFGAVLRSLGAIPVNRSQPGDLLRTISEQAKKHPNVGIAFCPEGTRKKVSGWKKGFYNVASELSLPIVFADWDPKSKKLEFFKEIEDASKLTFEEVMEKAKEFYSTRTGIYPEKASPVKYYKSKK